MLYGALPHSLSALQVHFWSLVLHVGPLLLLAHALSVEQPQRFKFLLQVGPQARGPAQSASLAQVQNPPLQADPS